MFSNLTIGSIKQYDINKDGILEPEEVRRLCESLHNRERRNLFYGKVFLSLMILLVVSVGANLGMSFWAVINSSEFKMSSSSSILRPFKSKSTAVVSTAPATVNIPLVYIPLAGTDVLNRITHISFKAMDITFNNYSIFSGFHSEFHLGMLVESYTYLNETSAILIGSNGQHLLINFGYVSAWGIPGTAENAVVQVCPGLVESSQGRCSIVSTTDVDITALYTRAKELGMFDSYSTRRRLSPLSVPGNIIYEDEEDFLSSSSSSTPLPQDDDNNDNDDMAVVADPLITIITPSKSPYRAPTGTPQLSSCYPPIVGR